MRAPLARFSKYAQSLNTSECLFLLPVECMGCQYCSLTKPSKSEARLATTAESMQMQYEIRVKAIGLATIYVRYQKPYDIP